MENLFFELSMYPVVFCCLCWFCYRHPNTVAEPDTSLKTPSATKTSLQIDQPVSLRLLPSGSSQPPSTRPSLKQKSAKQLKQMARERKVKGYSRMTKAQLLKVLSA